MLDHQQHMNAMGHPNRLLLNPPIEMEQVVYPSMPPQQQHSQGSIRRSLSSFYQYCTLLKLLFVNIAALYRNPVANGQQFIESTIFLQRVWQIVPKQQRPGQA